MFGLAPGDGKAFFGDPSSPLMTSRTSGGVGHVPSKRTSTRLISYLAALTLVVQITESKSHVRYERCAVMSMRLLLAQNIVDKVSLGDLGGDVPNVSIRFLDTDQELCSGIFRALAWLSH